MNTNPALFQAALPGSFIVHESNGTPDYLVVSSNLEAKTCCQIVKNLFPEAICHHTYSCFASAKVTMDSITARLFNMERPLHQALTGATISDEEIPIIAERFHLSTGEAAVLFGDSTTHAERIAMFNSLRRGTRIPAPSRNLALAAPEYKIEHILLTQ